MNLALAWILARSLRGRVVRAVAMLRRPKYLVGLLVGVGWMLLWLGPAVFGRGNVRFAGGAIAELPDAARGTLVWLGTAAVALWFSVTWLVPWGKPGLGFREAELHFLLPAPVPRRQVIGYAVLRAQPAVLVTTAVFTLAFGAGDAAGRLRAGVGLWLLVTTWDLASKARGLFLLRQREIEPARARTRWLVVVAVVAGFWAGVGPWIVGLVRDAVALFRRMVEGHGVVAADWLAMLSASAPGTLARWLLGPLMWVIGPFATRDSGRFWVALIPAILVMAALREVVVRSPARFEESALAGARRRAESKSPTRAYRRLSLGARRGQPFRLAPAAPPAAAVLWKNLTKVTRRPLKGWAMAGGALCLAATLVPVATGRVAVLAPSVAFIGAFLLGLPPVISGTMWSNDLRSELGSLDLVRTWPIAPRRLLLAEVAAPALLSAMLCALGAGLIVAAAASVRLHLLATGGTDVQGFALSGQTLAGVSGEVFLSLLAVGALLVAVATAFFSSAVQNLIALWFPAWIPRGRRSGDMAAFGSRMLFMWALSFAILLAALPGALLVGALAVVQWWLDIPWHALELLPAGGLVALPMSVAAAVLVRVAADLWERLDPSAEILEG